MNNLILPLVSFVILLSFSQALSPRFTLFSGTRGVVVALRAAQNNDGITNRVVRSQQKPEPNPSPTTDQIYFDIEVSGSAIGRLVFELPNPSPLPLHKENVVQLCAGDRVGIDPKATYQGCRFEFSPVYTEGQGQYRWAHVLKGYGRNAVGRADQPIVDAVNQLKCTHSCFGGQYYGVRYDEDEDDYPRVLLTVPITGPGHGTSRICIVRVGESPREWKERLLLNSGVIGKLVGEESLETLRVMARQNVGPPKIAKSGVIIQ